MRTGGNYGLLLIEDELVGSDELDSALGFGYLRHFFANNFQKLNFANRHDDKQKWVIIKAGTGRV